MCLQKDRQGITEMHREVCSCSVSRDGTAGASLNNVRGFPRAELGRFYLLQSLLKKRGRMGHPCVLSSRDGGQENTALGVQPLLGGS